MKDFAAPGFDTDDRYCGGQVVLLELLNNTIIQPTAAYVTYDALDSAGRNSLALQGLNNLVNYGRMAFLDDEVIEGVRVDGLKICRVDANTGRHHPNGFPGQSRPHRSA